MTPKTVNFSVIEGGKSEPKDFCAVCGAPFCTSRTLVGDEMLFACSDACATMLQGWRQVIERMKANQASAPDPT